ncbi:MAG: DUF4837 family protein [Prevotella sp.]
MKHYHLTMTVVALLIWGCSCDMKTVSGGRPYEVVVTGDDNDAVKHTRNILEAPYAEGLPQREPLFDVIMIQGKAPGMTDYSRSIVMADVDTGKYKSTKIEYDKNVFAKPQIIVRVGTPSVAMLSRDSLQIQKTLCGILTKFELSTEANRLKKAYSKAAARTVDSLFGHTIMADAEMKVVKRGKDFVWLADNATVTTRNICIYSYPGSRLDPEKAQAARDSVMKANIKGEAPDMYMTTAAHYKPTLSMTKIDEKTVMVMRGLWEMTGDAMGGPFVSHSMTDSTTNKIITAEAFVFAPGKKKRNMMKQLEAALFTIK